MTDWYPATVAAVHPEAEGLVEFILDIGETPLKGTHQRPGQYVRLSLPGLGEGVFALASPPEPEGHHWEFLLKGGSPLADALLLRRPGEVVHTSRPEGPGFPLEEARGRSLLLFATGSGISPIRAVIESIRRERAAYGQVTLYFGVRTPDAFAYEDELHQWEKMGIRVVRTVSQPGASGWQGLTGYVQAHLGEGPLADAAAFLSGHSIMVQEVIQALETRGVPRSAIHLNY
jgi:NAD(P)H-flavin reductase